MLGLLIILLVIAVTLGVVLWIGTVFLQGYFYTEPNPDAYWQGPALGGAIALFLLLWCLLDVNSDQEQVPYDTLFRFTAVEDLDKRPADKLWVIRAGVKEPMEYESHRTVKGYDYLDAVTKKPLGTFTGVEAVLMKDTTGKMGEAGEKVRFDRNKDADSGSNQFVSAQGWAMGENNLGLPSKFFFGRFLANVLLNFLHLAVWFVGLWLLLRFQWGHALGLAVVIWLVMTLAVLPMLMRLSGEIAHPPSAPAQSALNSQRPWAYLDPCQLVWQVSEFGS